MCQADITRLICDEARKGRRVVRLKGGDAGLFGRLTEETDALEALKIPFVVRPGVSALTAATTGTGLLLTRRGVSRGFMALTPRSTRAAKILWPRRPPPLRAQRDSTACLTPLAARRRYMRRSALRQTAPTFVSSARLRRMFRSQNPSGS